MDPSLLADRARFAAIAGPQSQMIIQVADAVGAEDCRRLMTMYDRHVHLTEVRDQTGFPVVYWPQFRDAGYAVEIVPRLVEECLRTIGNQPRFAEPLYPETVILAAIGAGGHHSLHADNCRQNEQGDWVANHTPHRDVSAIYYLNDEFDGGEIFFEQTQLTVTPRRGLLLAFPATPTMCMKFSRYAAACGTQCRFGSRSNQPAHCRWLGSAGRRDRFGKGGRSYVRLGCGTPSCRP